MTPPKIKPDAGRAAVLAVVEQLKKVEPVDTIDREQLALAVRYLLQRLEQAHPGHSVEVRVPPFGAVQAVEGPRHTRGTPANVVELAPADWVALATGHVSWAELASQAKLSASGIRSDIRELFPLAEW